jgi:hypothetical protein
MAQAVSSRWLMAEEPASGQVKGEAPEAASRQAGARYPTFRVAQRPLELLRWRKEVTYTGVKGIVGGAPSAAYQ